MISAAKEIDTCDAVIAFDHLAPKTFGHFRKSRVYTGVCWLGASLQRRKLNVTIDPLDPNQSMLQIYDEMVLIVVLSVTRCECC
jgi:hypothetical protein